MDGIIWLFVGSAAGLLTGKMIAAEGYGEVLRSNTTKGLDVLLGILGASIGGYLFFWIVIGEGSSLSRYGTAVLGSITVVGLTRVLSTRWRPLPATID